MSCYISPRDQYNEGYKMLPDFPYEVSWPIGTKNSSLVAFHDKLHVFNEGNHYSWDGQNWMSYDMLSPLVNPKATVHNDTLIIAGFLDESDDYVTFYQWLEPDPEYPQEDGWRDLTDDYIIAPIFDVSVFDSFFYYDLYGNGDILTALYKPIGSGSIEKWVYYNESAGRWDDVTYRYIDEEHGRTYNMYLDFPNLYWPNGRGFRTLIYDHYIYFAMSSCSLYGQDINNVIIVFDFSKIYQPSSTVTDSGFNLAAAPPSIIDQYGMLAAPPLMLDYMGRMHILCPERDKGILLQEGDPEPDYSIWRTHYSKDFDDLVVPVGSPSIPWTIEKVMPVIAHNACVFNNKIHYIEGHTHITYGYSQPISDFFKKVIRAWIAVHNKTIIEYSETKDTSFQIDPIKNYYELIDGEYIETADFYYDDEHSVWNTTMDPNKTYYELHPIHETVNKRVINAWVGTQLLGGPLINKHVLKARDGYYKVEDLPYDFYGGVALSYQGLIHIIGGSRKDTYGRYPDSINHYIFDGEAWSQSVPLDTNYTFNNNYTLRGTYCRSFDYKGMLAVYNQKGVGKAWNGDTWKSIPSLPYELNGNYSVFEYNDTIYFAYINNQTEDSSLYYYKGSNWYKSDYVPTNWWDPNHGRKPDEWVAPLPKDYKLGIAKQTSSNSYTIEYKSYAYGNVVVKDGELYYFSDVNTSVSPGNLTGVNLSSFMMTYGPGGSNTPNDDSLDYVYKYNKITKKWDKIVNMLSSYGFSNKDGKYPITIYHNKFEILVSSGYGVGTNEWCKRISYDGNLTFKEETLFNVDNMGVTDLDFNYQPSAVLNGNVYYLGGKKDGHPRQIMSTNSLGLFK